jgi:hypothetical protein
MDFLRDEKYANHVYPKRWNAMRNAYLAWHFDIDHLTVVKYFSKARKRQKEIDNRINDRFIHPRFNVYELSQIGELFMRYALILPDKAYLRDDEDFGSLSFEA